MWNWDLKAQYCFEVRRFSYQYFGTQCINNQRFSVPVFQKFRYNKGFYILVEIIMQNSYIGEDSLTSLSIQGSW